MEKSKYHRSCAVLFISMIFLCACDRPSRSEDTVAPAIALPDVDGKTVGLEEYRDKVVLLNFWGTTCAPCKTEMPWLVEFQKQYGSKGLQVVAVSMYGEGPEVLKPFMARYGMEDLRVLIGNEQVGQLFKVVAFPTTFIVDREGKLSSRHEGLIDRHAVENQFAALLNQP